MARAFAKRFYKSQQWQKVRSYVLMRDRYLCQKCGAPAEEVHHIQRLTPENIQDISVSLNPDNLISLCRACHQAEHTADRMKLERAVLPKLVFDEQGNAIAYKAIERT